MHIARWSSLVARWAHNPKVVGSNPALATRSKTLLKQFSRVFCCLAGDGTAAEPGDGRAAGAAQHAPPPWRKQSCRTWAVLVGLRFVRCDKPRRSQTLGSVCSIRRWGKDRLHAWGGFWRACRSGRRLPQWRPFVDRRMHKTIASCACTTRCSGVFISENLVGQALAALVLCSPLV